MHKQIRNSPQNYAVCFRFFLSVCYRNIFAGLFILIMSTGMYIQIKLKNNIETIRKIAVLRWIKCNRNIRLNTRLCTCKMTATDCYAMYEFHCTCICICICICVYAGRMERKESKSYRHFSLFASTWMLSI